MAGISRKTGQLLSGWDLVASLAEDALTTPLGSREKRRTYGSRLPQLLSKPMSDELLLLAQVYATETFIRPANQLSQLFTVNQVNAARRSGGLNLTILGQYQGQTMQMEVPIYANRS